MRAEIRSFEWEHENDDQSVGLVLHAGPVGGPGDETFHVSVCTPAALNVLLERDGIVVGRHLLLVDRVDRIRIEAFLADRLRRIDGKSWDVLAEKISRIGYWEFEDYIPSPDAPRIAGSGVG